MYISGVPGCGKTATITKVIRSLQLQMEQKALPEFKFIEINGMRLTETRQTYVQIYHQLTGETVSWEQAHFLLDTMFNTPELNRKPTILLMDEFDMIKSRRQDVVYNVLDWSGKKSAQLLVVAIGNIIDLERTLMNGVTSRLGQNRVIFPPYSYKQLQEIVQARLTGIDIFDIEAVELVARLDFCQFFRKNYH